MKKKNKKNLPIIVALVLVLVITGSFFAGKKVNTKEQNFSESAKVENLNSQILADGNVASEDEAVLHFQTGGKLVYLPLKEGDKVSKGQTIAKLDTYTIQKQLTQTLNNFKVTRNNFDQLQDNNKDKILNDIAKRIVDQQQMGLDNAVINVDLMNYAIQLSNLVSPINGTIIHQDVSEINMNITPANSFTVANTSKLIFKANLLEDYVQFVKEGDESVIKVKGDDTEYSGTVSKIYPEKIKLANGQSVYKIDIKSADLQKKAKYNQTGTVVIKPANREEILVVPSWTIENNKFVWVKNGNKVEQKSVVTGESFGDKTQIISGISIDDQIITDPKIIVKNKYKFY